MSRFDALTQANDIARYVNKDIEAAYRTLDLACIRLEHEIIPLSGLDQRFRDEAIRLRNQVQYKMSDIGELSREAHRLTDVISTILNQATEEEINRG